jgi:hypothetical protein
MTDAVLLPLLQLVAVSMMLERGLSLVFEHPLYQRIAVDGAKPIIALCFAWLICSGWRFDAVAAVMGSEPRHVGMLITALVIAGGAKVSLKLFRDVLKAGKQL